MARMPPTSWILDTPVPDFQTMTDQELVQTWHENRNSLVGTMAANERMTRLLNQQRKDDGQERS